MNINININLVIGLLLLILFMKMNKEKFSLGINLERNENVEELIENKSESIELNNLGKRLKAMKIDREELRGYDINESNEKVFNLPVTEEAKRMVDTKLYVKQFMSF